MYLFIYKYVNKKQVRKKRKEKSVTHSRFLLLKIQIKNGLLFSRTFVARNYL